MQKAPIVIFGALVLVLGIFSLVMIVREKPNPSLPQGDQNQEVTVSYVQNEEDEARILEAFPDDVPVEKSKIEEGYTVEYLDAGAKQYSVSYMTGTTLSDAYTSFKEYMTNNGYLITLDVIDESIASLHGANAEKSLSVTVSEQEDGRFVQVALIDRTTL